MATRSYTPAGNSSSIASPLPLPSWSRWAPSCCRRFFQSLFLASPSSIFPSSLRSSSPSPAAIRRRNAHRSRHRPAPGRSHQPAHRRQRHGEVRHRLHRGKYRHSGRRRKPHHPYHHQLSASSCSTAFCSSSSTGAFSASLISTSLAARASSRRGKYRRCAPHLLPPRQHQAHE